MDNIQRDNHSGYQVISNSLLRSKNLSDTDKIVLSVIFGLSEQKGYCWATNKQLAEYLGKSISSVRKNIYKLNEIGVLTTELLRDNTGQVIERRLYINHEKYNDQLQKCPETDRGIAQKGQGVCQKSNIGGMSENGQYTIQDSKQDNNTIQTKGGRKSGNDLDYQKYEDLIKDWNLLAIKSFKTWYDYRKSIRKKLTEYSVKALIKKWEHRQSDFIDAVEYTIAQGWQGLYEQDKKQSKNSNIKQEYADLCAKFEAEDNFNIK